jgi:cyclopropane fatty-acyl-phospholipid synthase-like methyltransferase
LTVPGSQHHDSTHPLLAELYCERAKLADGQDVLELGCGWGSLCLYVAAKYRRSRVTAVSNSATQREFITETAASRGIANLTVVTANLVDFQPPKSRLTGSSTYDRVVTIECFEHMKNYQVTGSWSC